MFEKNNSWHKIATRLEELDFADNNIAAVKINDKTICIGKYNNKPFAFAYTCPHAGAILSGGYIDALGNVVCPLHGYRYSVQNGRNVSGEGFHLKTWPVELRGDGVYIGMEIVPKS